MHVCLCACTCVCVCVCVCAYVLACVGVCAFEVRPRAWFSATGSGDFACLSRLAV